MSLARRTALSSLVAALALVGVKLLVGGLTGSLAFVAEAVHSGVDAGAALVTLYAVGVAERPPDREHQYGHGKAQHLSALAEAIVLAGAAVWIAVASVMRLASGSSDVRATWYAYVLALAVLVVDAGRTVVSVRVGRRERNEALLANAWHFASDFAGTLALIGGLVLVSAGHPGGDSVAALVVAGLVLAGAIHLGARNVGALMDRAPRGLDVEIADAVRGVPGVGEVRSVRVREAGGETFADVVIGVSRLEGLERSHDTMDAVERAVEQRVGRAHVTVHAEPFAAGERASERIAAAALRVAGVMEVHNVVVLDDGGAPSITLHARVADTLTLAAADDAVERLRSEIADEYGVSHVYVHVEPFSPEPRPARDVTADEPQLRGLALAAVRLVAGGAQELRLFRQEGRLLVITAVAADPALSVRQGHALASRVEDAVRDALPDVDDVIVEVTRR